MKKISHLSGLLMFSLLLISCSKDSDAPVSTSELIGTWRTYEKTEKESGNHYADDDGIVVEWGKWYIRDFELVSDGTLNLKTGNVSEWSFEEENSILYIIDGKTEEVIHQFNISINKEGHLILEDNYQILKHQRI